MHRPLLPTDTLDALTDRFGDELVWTAMIALLDHDSALLASTDRELADTLMRHTISEGMIDDLGARIDFGEDD